MARQRAALPPARDDRGGRADGVLCRAFLEYLPDEDIPRVLDRQFWRRPRLVAAAVALDPAPAAFPDRSHLPVTRRAMRMVAGPVRMGEPAAPDRTLAPLAAWYVMARPAAVRLGRPGGRPLRKPPLVWVLAYDKPGHTTQSVGLAEALGWPL